MIMEKPLTIHEKVDLCDSIYKSYSKKARTLRKRAASLNTSAEFYEREADRNKQNCEALLSIAFKSGDPVIVSGTKTGKGDIAGMVIEYANIYNAVPHYTVDAGGERWFVAQHHLKPIS
jgi:hypothetical protein